MNVRVLGKAPAGAPAKPADPAKPAKPAGSTSPPDPWLPPDAPGFDGDDDDANGADDPVSIGDRLRSALVGGKDKDPLYPRLLRLEHVHPNGWQRALLLEGMALVGGLVALADRATAWAPVVLPVGAAVVVKFHDVLAGLLPSAAAEEPDAGNDSAASPVSGNAAEDDES